MTPTYDGALAGIPTDEATVRKLDRTHVFHSWSAQALIDPLPIARARRARASPTTPASGTSTSPASWSTSTSATSTRKLVQAIADYAQQMTTIQPSFANDARSEAARLITEVAGHDLNQVFFTNGGAEANENAIRMARLHTGRPKILAMYRSYHGATHGVIGLTGDPRRWGTEPHTIPGIVHFWGPVPVPVGLPLLTDRGGDRARALQHLRDTIMVEGPARSPRSSSSRSSAPTASWCPPPGYLAGVREICDEHGILLIADEVMAGFGRCGEWFAIQHWDVRPDLITFAKGVNSGYVPLGGVVINDPVARDLPAARLPGRPHLLRSPARLRERGRLDRDLQGGRDRRARPQPRHTRSSDRSCAKLADRHPSVGEVRGLGVFWAVELVRDRATREPLVPYNAAGDAAADERVRRRLQAARALADDALQPDPRRTALHDRREADLREGLEILDEALEIGRLVLHGQLRTTPPAWAGRSATNCEGPDVSPSRYPAESGGAMSDCCDHDSGSDYFDLGDHHRPVTTTSADAQTWFDRGLAWTYGFHHEEAQRCFERAVEADPECAMAHWGIAYVVGPNYNKRVGRLRPRRPRSSRSPPLRGAGRTPSGLPRPGPRSSRPWSPPSPRATRSRRGRG